MKITDEELKKLEEISFKKLFKRKEPRYRILILVIKKFRNDVFTDIDQSTLEDDELLPYIIEALEQSGDAHRIIEKAAHLPPSNYKHYITIMAKYIISNC